MKDEKTYSTVKSVAVSLSISFVLSIILLLVFSWLIFAGPIKESASGAIVLAISLVSVFAGGFICARMKKSKGLIYGAILGAAYFLILYIISCFSGTRPDFAPASISVIIFGIGSGALGGIIGINTSKKISR